MGEANEAYPPAPGSALDFQTAPYEALCGCVAAMIPAGMDHLWKGDAPNHAATEFLIRNAIGDRVVLADYPKCGGTGITPNNSIAGGEAIP